MKKDMPCTDNDLGLIMAHALKAAAGLARAATGCAPGSDLRSSHLDAMHSAMIVVEQARQMAQRSEIVAATDEEIEAR
jgi:hypothetical protein